MAAMQAAPQPPDIRPGKTGQHLLFQRGHLVPVAVEQVAAAWHQRGDQPAAVGQVAVPLDQAGPLQGGDGLGGDEGVAGELRQDMSRWRSSVRRRGVLLRGQPGGAQQVVQPGAPDRAHYLHI